MNLDQIEYTVQRGVVISEQYGARWSERERTARDLRLTFDRIDLEEPAKMTTACQ